MALAVHHEHAIVGRGHRGGEVREDPDVALVPAGDDVGAGEVVAVLDPRRDEVDRAVARDPSRVVHRDEARAYGAVATGSGVGLHAGDHGAERVDEHPVARRVRRRHQPLEVHADAVIDRVDAGQLQLAGKPDPELVDLAGGERAAGGEPRGQLRLVDRLDEDLRRREPREARDDVGDLGLAPR